MTNTSVPDHQIGRSFVWRWVLANMVGLPVLLAPSGIGFFLLQGVALAADAGSTSLWLFVFLIISTIMAFIGAIVGGLLGIGQWFVLRKRVPRSGQWVLASSVGVAVGSFLSGPIDYAIFSDPIATLFERVDFLFLLLFTVIGIAMGVAIGVSQWFILKEWTSKAKWWIIVVPVSFIAGLLMLFAGFYLWLFTFAGLARLWAQRTASELPDIWVMYLVWFFTILSVFAALISFGLITGVLLDRLLRFHKKQAIQGSANGNSF